jgi:hypothetical protein
MDHGNRPSTRTGRGRRRIGGPGPDQRHREAGPACQQRGAAQRGDRAQRGDAAQRQRVEASGKKHHSGEKESPGGADQPDIAQRRQGARGQQGESVVHLISRRGFPDREGVGPETGAQRVGAEGAREDRETRDHRTGPGPAERAPAHSDPATVPGPSTAIPMAWYPLSTYSTLPVMAEASGLARNAAQWPTSAASSSRVSGAFRLLYSIMR